MITSNDRQSIDASARPSLDKKNQNVEHVEKTGGSEDLAAEILQRYPLLVEKSAEELAELNKKVLRILDWKFLPCVTVMLLMNWLVQEDLGMTDVEWSAGISLFYVGYLISQVPANVIMAKGSPRILFPICMLGWSFVTIAMPAMKSPWSFMLCRFLVGFTEGPSVPVVSLLCSSWYTSAESPLRMGIWHAGNIISNVISGILAAGILTNMDGIANLHAWQWFFIIEGIVSILVAIAAFWLLPNWPSTTGRYYFTEEESAMAQYRVDLSAGGISEDDEGTHWGGVWQACRDPFTWFFAAIHFFLVCAQSFKDFLPSIMATFGFDQIGTYLIQAPPYLFAYFFTLLLSWSSGRRMEHCWHIVFAIIVCALGAAIMISTLNVGARYFSIFLLCAGPFVGLNIQIAWETTVVPRPRTKRAALIAIANCLSGVSHWFTPYFFLRSQEPRYQTGGGVIIAGCGLTVVSCSAARWWAMRKNKKLDVQQESTGNVNPWRFAT